MDPPTDHPKGGGGQSTGEGHESLDRKGSIVDESTSSSMIYNTNLAAPGALAQRLQRNTAYNATPRATPHRLQNRQGQLTFPTFKNGDHFSTVIWALPSNFAK